MKASSKDILMLVREALDRFESDPVDASLRRAIRIATLLGDIPTALRFSLELQPFDGHKSFNAEDARHLAGDTLSYSTMRELHSAALEDFIQDRRTRTELIMARSLAEIDFFESQFRQSANDSLDGEMLQSIEECIRIRELARLRCYKRLCGWEAMLSFSLRNEALAGRYRKRVGEVLDDLAPDLLVGINAIFRRLNTNAKSVPQAPSGDDLNQVLTACRKILTATLEFVQPDDVKGSAAEESLSDTAQKERLLEFVKRLQSGSGSLTLEKAAVALYERLDATEMLVRRGIQAEAALREAEFCVLHTYLMCGEIIGLVASKKDSI